MRAPPNGANKRQKFYRFCPQTLPCGRQDYQFVAIPPRLAAGAPLTATHRDVKANGIRLRVTEAGDGPPLLLLHTTLLDRKCWEPLWESLAARFRVVAPDLPGFGESEKPGPRRFDYTIEAYRHAITDLYAGLGLGQAHVAGHGLGGAIALSLASRSPELVSSLQLISALCYRTPPDPAQRVARLPLVGSVIFKQLLGRAAFRSYFRDVMTGGSTALDLAAVDRYYEHFCTPSGRSSALSTLRATADTRPVEAQLGTVGCRTLVIWGRHDKVHPAAFGQRMAKEIRGAGFSLLNTGHVPQQEAPDPLAEVMSNFCLDRRAQG